MSIKFYFKFQAIAEKTAKKSWGYFFDARCGDAEGRWQKPAQVTIHNARNIRAIGFICLRYWHHFTSVSRRWGRSILVTRPDSLHRHKLAIDAQNNEARAVCRLIKCVSLLAVTR